MRPRAMRTVGWVRKVLDEPAPAAPEEAAAAPARTPAPPPAPRPATRIEPGCEIEGRLTLEGPLIVEGEFRGAIVCRSDVVVTETGTVEASIRGRSVVVRGAVVGDVEATRELVLAPTGRLHGAVDTPALVIERGAFFQGETRMFRPEQLARAVAPDGARPGASDAADAQAAGTAALRPPPAPGL